MSLASTEPDNNSVLRYHLNTRVDPKWFEATAALLPFAQRLTGRKDIQVRILPRIGAPARFIPTTAQMDISTGYLRDVNPSSMARPDFILTHPELVGALVHESAHGRFTRIGLPGLLKQYGKKWYGTWQLLEEARCERQLLPLLEPIEKAALEATVLQIVLRDSKKNGTAEEQLDSHRQSAHLVGLLAGRLAAGTITRENEKIDRLWLKMTTILGADTLKVFNDLAVSFSEIEWMTDDFYGVRNADVVKRYEPIIELWNAAYDDLPVPARKPKDPPEPEPKPEPKPTGESEPSPDGEPEPAPDSSDETADENDDGSSDDDGEDSENDSKPEAEGESREWDDDDEFDEEDGEGEGEGPSNDEDDEPNPGDEGESAEQGDGDAEEEHGTEDGGEGEGEEEEGEEKDSKDLLDDLTDAAEDVKDEVQKDSMTVETDKLASADKFTDVTRRQLKEEAMRRWKK